MPRERCLNVVINVPGPKRDPKKLLPMTLLAFAGYHKRQEMIKFLIDNHASMFVPYFVCHYLCCLYSKTCMQKNMPYQNTKIV